MARNFEYIKHFEGTAFKTFFITIDQRLHHWHEDAELLLVVEGSVIINSAGQEHLAEQGDLFLINRNEIHSLRRTREGNILLAIQFGTGFCSDYFPRLRLTQFTARHVRRAENPVGWGAVTACLSTLLADYWRRDFAFQFRVMAGLNDLVFQLLTHLAWREADERQRAAEEAGFARLSRIMGFVQANYMNRVTLKQLAAGENLDMYYLSHFIKSKLGISFQQYLTRVRLEKAVPLLLRTNKKLLDISLECGFSDSRYLTRAFTAEFGCPPARYRLEYQDCPPVFLQPGSDEQHRLVDHAQAMAKLRALCGESAGG